MPEPLSCVARAFSVYPRSIEHARVIADHRASDWRRKATDDTPEGMVVCGVCHPSPFPVDLTETRGGGAS